jgi:hypothetical protein
MILDTSATEITYRNLVPYYFAASGGDVKLERKLSTGAWLELNNSPILNGEEVEVITITANSKLRATATANPTELAFGELK